MSRLDLDAVTLEFQHFDIPEDASRINVQA